MRIGVLSPAPFVASGYGIQASYLLRTLRALGHEAACFAFTGLSGSPLMWQGSLVYPKLFHEMGQDMAMHARHFGADVVMPLMDIWHIQHAAWDGIPLCPYFPVDHEPLSPHLARIIAGCHTPIVFSQFGQRMCKDAGLDVAYIPCAVDTDIYAPIDRTEAREALGWPQDRYIVGMVQANAGRPSRKAFEPQLRAFKWFQNEHPEALLYLHTFVNAGREIDGDNILGMLASLDLQLGRDVIIPDQYAYTVGIPQAQLSRCYNAMNVLLQVTSGEGFGVPLIEAQACGTPVITGDWTSMPELCFAGWSVPRLTAEVYGREVNDDELWGTLEGYKVQPRASAIVTALEASYQDGDTLRQRARDGALAFGVEAIADRYWRPMLASIEGRL